jgi:hypothetical protein
MARKKRSNKGTTTTRKARLTEGNAAANQKKYRCSQYITPESDNPDYPTRLASALSANLHIAGSQSIVINGNQGIAVAKDQCVQTGNDQYHYIGGKQHVQIVNDQQIEIGGDQVINVGDDCTMAIGKDVAVKVGRDYKLQVAKSLNIVCGDEVTVTVGKSRVRMKSNGHIEIFGNVVDIISTNELNIEGPKVRIRGDISLRLEGNETQII